MFNFRNIPIRRKLTLIIFLTSTAAVLLVATSMAVYSVMKFRQTLIRHLSIEAEIIAANSAAALAFSDSDAAAEILSALDAQPGIVHARLFAANGDVLAEFKTGEALPPLENGSPGHQFADGYLVLNQPVKFAGEVIGNIVLRSSLYEQNARIKAVLSIALVAFFAALLASLILSLRLQRVISEPILNLAQVAHEVTLRKDYTLRALQKSDDEIGILIGEFNQMLAQIEKSDADLRASEERFRQLADNVNEVFWITDIFQNEMIYVSPAYETIWGRTCASLYSSPLSWSQSIHSEDQQRVVGAMENLQAAGDYNEVYRILRPDGETRWIHDRGFPVRDKKGTVYRIAGIAEDISERKAVEETLRRVEANYRSIFDNAAEGIFQTTPEGRYLAANPAMARILGFQSPEELIGSVKNIADEICVTPASRIELQNRLLTDGFVHDFENQLYRKDGSIVWISVNARCVRDPSGKILYFEGTTTDITSRKRAEKQNTVFAALAAGLSAATTPREAAWCIMDSADKLFGWDCGFVQLYDPEAERVMPILAFDEVDGKRIEIPEMSTTPGRMIHIVVEKGPLLLGEQDRQALGIKFTPFGNTARLSASMMFVLVRQSARILGIVSIQSYSPNQYGKADLVLLQALADHCSGALQRIQINEELREAEAKYRGIFEEATEGIFQTTPEGIYLSANSALAEMLGYPSPEEMLANVKNIEKQTYVLPERRQQLKQILEKQGFVQNFEAERYRKDGSKFWISLNARTIRDAKGAVQYFEGTTRDITTRRRLEKQLIEISDREQSRIGHDLHDGLCQHLVRTALAANLLEKDLQSQPEQLRQAQKVAKLMDDAITQSRNLARGLYPVKIELEGLDSAMHELAANVRSAYGIECQFESPDSVLIADHAIATHLYRIAQEASNNALKHASPRSIQIRLQSLEDKIQLTVNDDGCGFSTPQPGTMGMGLHIMNYRAGMIGGTIKIDTKPDEGTSVFCQFNYSNGSEKTLNTQKNGRL